MRSFASRRALRITLIVLYTMATAFVAVSLPTRAAFSVSEPGVVLPGGQVAVLCHPDDAGGLPGGDLPDGADHRACCSACLFAGAPGLPSLFDTSTSLPLKGHTVEAGFVVSERIAIELLRPASRGPPQA